MTIAVDALLPLVQAARRQEGRAWDRLLREHQLALFAYVAEMVRDESAALDIVQESFAAAVKHIGGLRNDSAAGFALGMENECSRIGAIPLTQVADFAEAFSKIARQSVQVADRAKDVRVSISVSAPDADSAVRMICHQLLEDGIVARESSDGIELDLAPTVARSAPANEGSVPANPTNAPQKRKGLSGQDPQTLAKLAAKIARLKATLAEWAADPRGFTERGIRKEYAPLISALTADQQKEFVTLVLDERILARHQPSGSRDTSQPDTETEQTSVAGTGVQSEASIKALLGDTLYSTYRELTERFPVHLFIGTFVAVERNHAAPLDDLETSLLAGSMVDAFKLIDPKLMSFDWTKHRYSPQEFNVLATERAEAYEIVLRDAAAFMAADQLQVLQHFLQQQNRYADRHRPTLQ